MVRLSGFATSWDLCGRFRVGIACMRSDFLFVAKCEKIVRLNLVSGRAKVLGVYESICVRV